MDSGICVQKKNINILNKIKRISSIIRKIFRIYFSLKICININKLSKYFFEKCV